MNIVVTMAADLDPDGIACRHCRKLLSVANKSDQTLTPTIEELDRDGAVAVPNFGWFCGQDCGDAYSREYGVAFQRDATGRIAYY